MGKVHDNLEKACDEAAEVLQQLAVILLEEIHDEYELHEIMLDTDLERRPLVEVASFRDVLDLFKHNSISVVTDKIWCGPYLAREEPFTSTSHLLANLTHKPTSHIDLFFRSYPKLFNRNYLNFHTHNFQYVAWRDGLQCRYMIDAIYYFVLFSVSYSLFYTLTLHGREASEIQTKRTANEETPSISEISLLASSYSDMADSLINIQILFVVLFAVNFRHLILLLFAFLTSRNPVSMVADMVLDLLLSVGIILHFTLVYPDFLPTLDYRSNMPIFISKSTEFWRDNNWVIPLFGLFIAVLFIRMLNTLKVHSLIGPFIEMIKQMVMRIGTFGVLFVLLLFFFAMVAALFVPYSVPGYRTLYVSIMQLFQASVGVFDLNAMNNEVKGEIFIVIYVIVFNILLLNLLIAILTQVYTMVTQQADTFYVRNLVIMHALYAPHPLYSSLINSFPPFNFFFGLVFLPFLLLCPLHQRHKLNLIFLQIEYTLSFALIFLLYLAIECIIACFCYVKITFHLAILIFTGQDWSAPRRVAHFFLFLCLGPLLLLPVMASDCYYFTKHAYSNVGQPRFAKETKEPMHKDVFKKLRRFIDEVRKTHQHVPFEFLRKRLYEMCAITIVSQAPTPAAIPTPPAASLEPGAGPPVVLVPSPEGSPRAQSKSGLVKVSEQKSGSKYKTRFRPGLRFIRSCALLLGVLQ